jgi:hypothetical protein
MKLPARFGIELNHGWNWHQFMFGWERFYWDGYHDLIHFGFLVVEFYH